MNKPNELTGRVITLSELIGRAVANSYTRTDTERLNDVDKFNDFYSQPFTPKLLEYFEWWDDSGSFYVMKRDEEFKLYRDEEFILSFQTLSDFITLCNLAGVELNWKE